MSEPKSVVAPHLAQLLREIGPVLNQYGLTLVGGTALALHLNHRRSLDLDFFGAEEFDPDERFLELEEKLGSQHAIEVVGKDRNTLNRLVEGVKVDLMRHGYPETSPPVDWEGVMISAPEDIAAMKLNAIANRGAKKDFFDLYFLLQRFSLSQLLESYGKKYRNHDAFFVIQSLTYFDDAEAQPEPELQKEVSWYDVKSAIVRAVKDFERE